MDNTGKFKLSFYKEIKKLNDEGTAVLCFNDFESELCVVKYVDSNAYDIYCKIKNIENEFLTKIYDTFVVGDKFVIVEEYIKGNLIEEIVREKGCISEENALKYIKDIAKALIGVHSLGIIHRDISPDNIIVDDKNRARLLDFDIARVESKGKTMDTTILGTAGFASPEQFGFAQTDVRSDIYSLGVLLNYMLTGKLIQEKIYENSSFRNVIEKATKIAPEQRYNNVGEFLSAIGENDSYINYIDENKCFIDRIPGFRTNNKVKVTLAVCMYLSYIIVICGSVFIDKNLKEVILYTLTYLFYFYLPMWWFGNRGKFLEKLPVLSKMNKKTRTIFAVIIYFIILIVVTNGIIVKFR